MSTLRGEEQIGFAEILGNWLEQQPWVPRIKGRRSLRRVGGLRLPTPQGETDPHVVLEVHILEIPDPSIEGHIRVSVPVALRSRPSAVAGKSAFIGKLHTAAGEELWMYDGARDRSAVLALAEMARRGQGSRNGRSRGTALAGFDRRAPLNLQMQRRVEPLRGQWGTRTVLSSDPATDDEFDVVAVDVLRQPVARQDAAFETAMVLTQGHSTSIARVLGVVSASWQENENVSSIAAQAFWETGAICVIRETSTVSDHAGLRLERALENGDPFLDGARAMGLALGSFHADAAGAFGSYTQTADQLRRSASAVQSSLNHQWEQVQKDFDPEETSAMTEILELMNSELTTLNEPVQLQRIHGCLSLEHFYPLHDQRWVLWESGGMAEHASNAEDVIAVLVSVAETVLATAKRAESSHVPSQAGGGSFDFGQWYESFARELLNAYRETEADPRGVESVIFRARMAKEHLALFHCWDAPQALRLKVLLSHFRW